jgi:hypothetical protein
MMKKTRIAERTPAGNPMNIKKKLWLKETQLQQLLQ